MLELQLWAALDQRPAALTCIWQGCKTDRFASVLACAHREAPGTVDPLRTGHDRPGSSLTAYVLYRYAWIAVADPSLLDYQNAEMVLIGERSDDTRALSGQQRRPPLLFMTCCHCASAVCTIMLLTIKLSALRGAYSRADRLRKVPSRGSLRHAGWLHRVHAA